MDRVLSYIVDLRRISPLFFIPLVPYPARSARHLPLEGKALFARIVFPHMHIFALTMREKRYSRFVTFPIGEGGPRSGARVLSLIACLRCISSLFFIPPSPSNLRPFGAPPSIGRREYPRKPLPLEGAAERSEAGLASFFGGKAASSLPSPLGKGTTSAVDRVLSLIVDLRRISPLFFIPLVPYPPLRGTFPSRGRLCVEDSVVLVSQPSPLGKGDRVSGG